MLYPFTRFDFTFDGRKVCADYEDVDGILYFSFRIDDQIEFSARLIQSGIEFFVEIDQLHYGEKPILNQRPMTTYKGRGLPAACIEQIMRKHPELRFAIRANLANEHALRLAQQVSRDHLLFFIL